MKVLAFCDQRGRVINSPIPISAEVNELLSVTKKKKKQLIIIKNFIAEKKISVKASELKSFSDMFSQYAITVVEIETNPEIDIVSQ